MSVQPAKTFMINASRMNRIALLVLIFLFAAASLSCQQKKDSVYKKTEALMDTVVSITVVSSSKDAAEAAIDRAFRDISRLGDMVNFYSDRSELAEINRNAGMKAVRISPETFEVIEKALFVASKSDGAFDPSIGPLVKLWDFKNRKRPSDPEIRRVMPLVNYRNIMINRTDLTVFLRKGGMMLDLGAIAKGYAADLGVESLKKSGIASGLVAIAGDIRSFGKKPDNSEWIIGIKNPRPAGEEDEIMATIKLSDKAISTAGDYERYFIDNGTRYHHILDPNTGYPGDQSRSVSIITEKGVDADGFDTAIFVLGPEKGMKLAKDMGMDAIIIDGKGRLEMTSSLKDKLRFEKGH